VIACSKLSVEVTRRFRKSAKLQNVRRIADERVRAWIEAGVLEGGVVFADDAPEIHPRCPIATASPRGHRR
jgi:hypothetical protein